ncbi:hypothetical protein BJX68DRAFT_219977 [Aspergillus pseudodeflectus]|uniref:Uncharacterized protein n=1 Tax=Aspergillus pseudodeflectus TaxID=176178 RepID=A0ABR4JC79_9EURO
MPPPQHRDQSHSLSHPYRYRFQHFRPISHLPAPDSAKPSQSPKAAPAPDPGDRASDSSGACRFRGGGILPRRGLRGGGLSWRGGVLLLFFLVSFSLVMDFRGEEGLRNRKDAGWGGGADRVESLLRARACRRGRGGLYLIYLYLYPYLGPLLV